MAQAMSIFKKQGDEYSRYWANISILPSDEGSKKKKKSYESATISVSMSKKAAKAFDRIAEETKNDDVTYAFVRVTDCWLKGVKGKDENFVILFVNELSEVKRKSDDDEEDD